MHVAPAVCDDVDLDLMVDDPVDNPVGLEMNLAECAVANREKLARVIATVWQGRQGREGFLDLM